MLINYLLDCFHDEILQKPRSTFKLKTIGVRDGESALVYYIKSRGGEWFNEKGITESEFHISLYQLTTTGSFTRKFFDNELKRCKVDGGCSFTTIGSLFVALGLAEYGGNGLYHCIINRN